jgi:hypothetical protein
MFDPDEDETYSFIDDLYKSIENINTAIRLFKQGITGVLRTGRSKYYNNYYNKYLKYKNKYLSLKNN